jgi:hypothetical protein
MYMYYSFQLFGSQKFYCMTFNVVIVNISVSVSKIYNMEVYYIYIYIYIVFCVFL